MERAAALGRHKVIAAADFGFLQGTQPVAEHDWLAGDLPTALARLETAMIRRALSASGGNRAEAARRLGIHRQLLYQKLERYGPELEIPDG